VHASSGEPSPSAWSPTTTNEKRSEEVKNAVMKEVKK
jgi:hypothetical protein